MGCISSSLKGDPIPDLTTPSRPSQPSKSNVVISQTEELPTFDSTFTRDLPEKQDSKYTITSQESKEAQLLPQTFESTFTYNIPEEQHHDSRPSSPIRDSQPQALAFDSAFSHHLPQDQEPNSTFTPQPPISHPFDSTFSFSHQLPQDQPPEPPNPIPTTLKSPSKDLAHHSPPPSSPEPRPKQSLYARFRARKLGSPEPRDADGRGLYTGMTSEELVRLARGQKVEWMGVVGAGGGGG